MGSTVQQLERAYLITQLGYNDSVAASKSLGDLRYDFYLNPPVGGGGDPTLGGDLSGTASNAQLAAGSVGTTELAALAVTDAKVAAANKDGAAGTVSMRSLGVGATQAAAGNHTHTIDPAVGGDLSGTASNAQIVANAVGTTEIAALAVTDAKVAAANKDGLAATASMRTIGTGAQQAAAGNHTHTNMEVTTNKDTASGYAGLNASALLPIATAPAGSLHTVEKSGGVWPNRPSSRTDIRVAWIGADPSPSIVTSPAVNGMYNGDLRWITP